MVTTTPSGSAGSVQDRSIVVPNWFENVRSVAGLGARMVTGAPENSGTKVPSV